jgi:hypothetical protein
MFDDCLIIALSPNGKSIANWFTDHVKELTQQLS